MKWEGRVTFSGIPTAQQLCYGRDCNTAATFAPACVHDASEYAQSVPTHPCIITPAINITPGIISPRHCSAVPFYCFCCSRPPMLMFYETDTSLTLQPVRREKLYLGVYESEVDAAKAHDRAARFHFADSAVCNFDSEHEADRQAVIHKQRQLLQQQQLAEDPAAAAAVAAHHHHAQLHGGSFSVGREEFDDLEEYHRGMDEATTCSSEEDDGEGLDNDESLHGDDLDDEIDDSVHGGEEDHHRRRGGLDGDDGELPAAECDMSDEGGDRYEEDGVIGGGATSGRPMSCSYSSAMSTGSMSDGGGGGRGHRAGHSRSRSCEVTAVAADGSAFAQAAAAAAAAAAVSHRGGAGNGNNNDMHLQQLQQQRGRCSSGESDCSSDFVTPSLLREESMSSSTQEGMGFPVAEDLLGYEMQSWYCCQDDEERSPSTSGGASFGSQLQQQQPFMGRQQQQQQHQSEELWGTAVGANLGWGFGDFAQTYSDGGSRASSGSMSSSLSCDDEYVPSALPPLMGMSATEA